jgi:HEAT repeat protein
MAGTPENRMAPEPLPANAKGVVFFASLPSGLGGFEKPPGVVLAESPVPPAAADFRIRDLTRGRTLPAVVRRLRAQPPGYAASRYFLIREPTTKHCFSDFGDQGKVCKDLRRVENDDPAWFTKRLAQGAIIDITAGVQRATGLFRIAPRGGFVAGHEYKIDYPPDLETSKYASLRVHIDDRRLTQPIAGSVQLERSGGDYLSPKSYWRGTDHYGSRVYYPARTQRLRYRVSPPFGPYRNALLFFTLQSNDRAHFLPLTFSETACGWKPLEQRARPDFAEASISGSCESFTPESAPAAKGFYGFLEVEDALHETATLTLGPTAARPEECTLGNMLKQIGPERDVAVLRELTCAANPVLKLHQEDLHREGVEREIYDKLLAMAGHPDAEVRQCAVSSLGLIRPWPSASDGFRRELALRLETALADEQAPMRKAAAHSLMELAGPWTFATTLPKDDIDRLVAFLVKALRDEDGDVRADAASTLASLGPAAAPALPALVAVVKDPALSNDQAVYALAALKTGRATVISTLIEVLDSYRRGSAAARVLAASPESTSPAVIAALIESAKKDMDHSVEALGQIGPPAQAAVPLLLERAKNPAVRGYARIDAIEALIAIGADETEIREAIVFNLGHRSPDDGTFTRLKAIQVLGKLERKAQPALPDLLKILEENPTDYEFSILINTLGQMEAPPETTKPVLMKALDQKDWNLRTKAAEGLLKRPPVDGVVLARMLADTENHNMDLALNYIGDASRLIENEQALPPALVRLLEASLDDDSRYRAESARALTAMHRLGLRDTASCRAVRRWEERHPGVKPDVPLAEVKARVCP